MYIKQAHSVSRRVFTGQVLAIASNDGTLKMYTVATGEVRVMATYMYMKKKYFKLNSCSRRYASHALHETLQITSRYTYQRTSMHTDCQTPQNTQTVMMRIESFGYLLYRWTNMYSYKPYITWCLMTMLPAFSPPDELTGWSRGRCSVLPVRQVRRLPRHRRQRLDRQNLVVVTSCVRRRRDTVGCQV